MYQTELCVVLESTVLIVKICPNGTGSKGFPYHSANYFLQYEVTSELPSAEIDSTTVRESRFSGTPTYISLIPIRAVTSSLVRQAIRHPFSSIHIYIYF